MTTEQAIERVESMVAAEESGLLWGGTIPENAEALRIVLDRAKFNPWLRGHPPTCGGCGVEMTEVRPLCSLCAPAAKEPRVYALGEEHRRVLQPMLDDYEVTVKDAESFNDGYIAECRPIRDALAAALALQEPFTVEEANLLRSAVERIPGSVGWGDHRDYQACAETGECRGCAEVVALLAKLRAYIEARQVVEQDRS